MVTRVGFVFGFGDEDGGSEGGDSTSADGGTEVGSV